MENEKRTSLVAPCGIDCGVCEAYQSRNSEPLTAYLISRGFPAEKLPCDGCRVVEGNCPVKSGTCATWQCVQSNAVEFCHECASFPCVKLAPAADRANILPHNTKMYNLCVIKNRGVGAFVAESATIKALYYKGVMHIGEGPSLPAADETGGTAAS